MPLKGQKAEEQGAVTKTLLIQDERGKCEGNRIGEKIVIT
jgi:hypothetical protein